MEGDAPAVIHNSYSLL